jgi:hypothetical protein
VHQQSHAAKERRSAIRLLFAALIIALTVISAGQISPAQAAPAGATELRFFMIATKYGGSKYVCVGEQVGVQALIYRHKVGDGVDEGLDVVTGVPVSGGVDNPSIGTLSPDSSTTSMASKSYPGAAEFVFKAEKSGETTVKFLAGVATPGWFGTSFKGGSTFVSADVPVRVENCKFKVTTIGEWHVPGPASISVAAISDDVEVKGGPDGSYKGSGTVNWIASADRVQDCGGTLTLGSSQVDWTGNMDNSGQLSLNGSYQPAAGSIDATCANAQGSGSGSFPVQLTPNPVRLSAASSGGGSSQSQLLQGPEPTSGSVVIVVIPEECSSTAPC